MFLLVKVRVRLASLARFAAALQSGQLDNSRVRGETWCLKDDPSVGLSVWETKDRRDFDARFDPWREFYEQVEISEVFPPRDAMIALSRMAGPG